MNVTDKKNFEGDRIFKLIAESSMDAIIVMNNKIEEESELKIEYANPAYLELTGYSMEEVQGASPKILKGQKTSQKTLDILREQMLEGKVFKGKLISYKKNKEEFINEWTVNPVFNSKGEIIKYFAIIRDVTQEEKRKQKLIEREKIHRSILEKMPIGIAVFVDDKVELFNKRASSIFKWPEDKLVHTDFRKFIKESDKDQVRNILSILYKGNLESFGPNIISALDINGNDIELQASFTRTTFKDQPAIMVSFIDVTVYNQLLKEQQTLQEMILDIDDQIFFIDKDSGVVMYSNPSAHIDLNMSLEELHNKKITEILANDTEERLFLVQKEDFLVSDKRSVSFETKFKRKNGSIYPVKIILRKVKSDPQLLLITVVNISDLLSWNKRIALTRLVNDTLIEHQNEENVVSEVLKIICNELNFEIGLIWELDNFEAFENKFSYYVDDAVFDVVKKLPDHLEFRDAGVLYRLLLFNSTLFLNTPLNQEDEFGAINELVERTNAKTLIGVPITISSEDFGVVTFLSKEKQVFDEELAQLLTNTGIQIAQFIRMKNLEKNLMELIGEKDVLLKEIHHRVKNNLQTVSSLLFLKSTEIEDEKLKQFFTDSKNRIEAISLIHEKLFHTKEYNFINLKEYLEGLILNLRKSNLNTTCHVNLITEIDSVIVSTDMAMNFGLLINEIVTNSFQHAFPGRDEGKINVSLDKKDNKIELNIHDDGVGFEKDNIHESMGIELIKMFAQQLRGELNIDSIPGDGVFYHLEVDINE
ncbi:PAS domain S-box protein [Mangrovivirga sp. M17]|uniref:histidine kinase n=1 Tax=Mangrovivirga halotolerans TaxID=2993936 RepID=A0ABT3RN03_9BACT|nr:PAS domain S-box protein [Mangrovivirga halotolerans]MCX2743198.1 PAS domain S-box protein [Mangrovivirga halotolerans]